MLPVAMDVNRGGLVKTPKKQAQSPTLSREMVAPACVSEDLGGAGEKTRGSTRRQEEGRVNGGVHPEARGDADDTDEICDGGGPGHGADSASEEVTSARGDVESSAVSTGPRSSSVAVASTIRLPPVQSSATAESAPRPSSDIAALLSTPTPVSTSSALPPSSTPPHPSSPPPSSSLTLPPSSSSPPQPSTSPPPPRSTTPPTPSSSSPPQPSTSPLSSPPPPRTSTPPTPSSSPSSSPPQPSTSALSSPPPRTSTSTTLSSSPSPSPSSSSPPEPSTSPLSSSPPPRTSTSTTPSSSPSSPSSPSAAAYTRGPVSTTAVSAFSDDDDFGEFEAAPSHTAALGWLEPRGGSPHSRGVAEWPPETVGGPARELVRSRGSDAASRGAVKALVSGSRDDDDAAAAAALRRALEECFSTEPPTMTTTTGRCAEHGDSDSRPAADETVTPLARHLLGETPAGDTVADNGPLPSSVWPKLRTVEDGETWRMPWATSHACRQLRRALGAARARTPLSADEEERIPDCPEEGEETAARPTKPWDLAVKKETMQEPVIHTRVTAGRYRPRSADGVVTLARTPVRTVFGFVRPGPS